MTDPEDPGDPFREGSLRFIARQKMLDALDDLVEDALTDDRKPIREVRSYALLISTHQEWARLGRDASC